MKSRTSVVAMLACVLAVAGCSIMDPKPGDKDGTDAGVTQDFGTVSLTVDAKGRFVNLRTDAVAQVREDSPAGKEAAMTVAAARARRNIVEFLTMELKSNEAISTFAKETHQGSEHAQEVLEKISENAQGILRGAYISRQSLDNDAARVEMTVSRNSMRAALAVRQQMHSGGSN